MKPFVSLHGTSKANTVIQSLSNGCVIEGQGTQISNLTVRNLGIHGAGEEACGLSNLSKISDVDVVLEGRADEMTGIKGTSSQSVSLIDRTTITVQNRRVNSRVVGLSAPGLDMIVKDSSIFATTNSSGLLVAAVGVEVIESNIRLFNSDVSVSSPLPDGNNATSDGSRALSSLLSNFAVRSSRVRESQYIASAV